MAKKSTDAISEVKAVAGKAGEATKKAAKKTATTAKKTATTAKKTAAAAAKGASDTVKKTTARKKAIAPSVAIQSIMGGEIHIDEIVAKVNDKIGAKVYEEFRIYVKPEENKAFYVADGEEDYVELW